MIVVVKVTDNIVKTTTTTAIVSVIITITDIDIDIATSLLATLILLLYC